MDFMSVENFIREETLDVYSVQLFRCRFSFSSLLTGILAEYFRVKNLLYFRENMKSFLTIPLKYPAVDTLRSNIDVYKACP